MRERFDRRITGDKATTDGKCIEMANAPTPGLLIWLEPVKDVSPAPTTSSLPAKTH
jgi:hypothetical protein